MVTDSPKRVSRFSEFSKAKQLEWKRKMIIFSFFLFVAVVIWLLNALSKDYTGEIKYPIAYSRFPAEKILVSDVPHHLGLKVNAHGYALLSYKLTNRPIPINFPISSFTMNTVAGDSTKFYVLTRFARERIARQLPGELELLEIAPDTLFFQFANEISRWIPVEPSLTYNVGRDFTIVNGVEILPESTLVSGPDIYLDTMKSLRTEKSELGILEKSITGTLKIEQIPRLSYQDSRISYNIILEKLTEIQLQVPVQIIGLPDSLRMQTFPQQVRITGKIGLSQYERIVPEAFRIVVDYNEVLLKKDLLTVQMVTSPEELSGADFYPKTVEYLLSLK
jgi:hypothetical protein